MDRWSQIEQILLELVDLPETVRSQYLDEACGSDLGLRREIETLLHCEERADASLAAAVGNAIRSFSAEGASGRAGQSIGPYRLLREIGRGGMGTVYLAERQHGFAQQVALKLVSRGMETDAVLKRFVQERQILASLNHQNIGAIFDGGTSPDGLPYLVMEYIPGEPITEWCAGRQLSVAARLLLFRQVCAGVHHAHQKLVIHRDIKPGNILVTDGGIAKLLDFGVAKVLSGEPGTDQLTRTEGPGLAMTPDYASPEQIRGERLTTATDVYSLGALLYELIASERPFRLADSTPEEMRIACTSDPVPPSEAAMRAGHEARDIDKDLDNIILMAMHKDPARRYGSAEQMSDDIDRYLRKLPVIARKDSLRYRAGKLMSRHRAAVLAAALLLITFLGGLAATAVQARIARQQQTVAEKRFADLRRFANSVIFELYDSIEALPGSTAARGLLVKRSLEYLDGVERESQADPTLMRELALAYRRVGDVQGRRSMPNLGDTPGALRSYRKSVALSEQLLQSNAAGLADRREAATGYGRISSLLLMAGDTTGALEQDRKALAIREQLVDLDPANGEYELDLAASYLDIGMVLSDREDFAGAATQFRRCLDVRRRRAIREPDNAELQRSLAIAYRRLGAALVRSHKPVEAHEALRSAAVIEELALQAQPANTRARLDLSFTVMELGYALAEQGGDVNGALAQYRRAAALRESVVRDDPTDARALSALAVTYQRLGLLMLKPGKADEAIRVLERAVALHRRVEQADPESVVKVVQSAVALADLGLAQQSAAEAAHQASPGPYWRAARASYTASLQIHQRLRDKDQDHWLLHRPNHTNAAQLQSRITMCDAGLSGTTKRLSY